MRIFITTFILLSLIVLSTCNTAHKEQMQRGIDLKDLGNDYYVKANYDSALHYYRQAQNIFNSIGDKANLGKVHHNIGMSFNDKNQYDSALFNYQKALVYKIETSLYYSDTYKMIGHIHSNYGNNRFALEYYFKSLLNVDSIKFPSEKNLLYADIGFVYKKKEQYDSSLVYLHKAMRDTSPDFDFGFVYANLAITYDSLQQTDSALFYYHKSLNWLNTQKKDINITSSVMASLGSLFIRQSNIDSATHYKSRIDSIFYYVTNKEYVNEILLMYSKYYALRSDINKAYSYNNQYLDSWLALYNQNRTIGYSVMQVELNLAENEAKLIENEKREQRNRLVSIIVILLIVSFSIILFIIISSRNRRRTQKQKHRFEIEKNAAVAQTLFEAEEKSKYDLSDYIHTTLASDVRDVSEIIKETPIEEQSKENILTRTTEIWKKVRSVSHELGPASLKTNGLKDALFDMSQDIEEIYHISVNMICTIEQRFDENFELKVYRIIQDLKNNILAHAQATEIDIQLLKAGDKLSITVEDNGVGFDTQSTEKKKGIGVRNIEAKVGNLKGNVEFNSIIGDGTCVLIEIPIE